MKMCICVYVLLQVYGHMHENVYLCLRVVASIGGTQDTDRDA